MNTIIEYLNKNKILVSDTYIKQFTIPIENIKYIIIYDDPALNDFILSAKSSDTLIIYHLLCNQVLNSILDIILPFTSSKIIYNMSDKLTVFKKEYSEYYMSGTSEEDKMLYTQLSIFLKNDVK